MRNWKVFVGLVLVLAMVAAACGDDDAETTTTEAPATTQATTTTTQAATTTQAETTTTTAAETTTTAAALPALVVWGDEQREDVVRAAAEDFTADTGIPVEFQLKDRDSIRADVQVAAPAGEGPDLFIGAHDWLGEMVANGIVSSIDIGATADEFYGIAIDSFTLGGELYGLPYAIEMVSLFRNTDLAPDAPETFEDLLAACEAVADQVTNCLGVPAGDAYANQAFIAGFGGYIFGFEGGFDATDVGLDSDGAQAGATWLDEQVKAGVLDPSIGWDESRDLFNQGQQVFMWDGPWQTAGIPEDIDFGVSPFPSIDGNFPVPFVGVQGFFLSDFSEQPVAALTFLTEYLATEDAMYRLYEEGGRPPAHIGAYERVAAEDPIVAGFGDAALAAPSSVLMPNIPEMSSVWGALGDAISVIYNQSYGDEVADAAAAMVRAAEQVRDAIAG